MIKTHRQFLTTARQLTKLNDAVLQCKLGKVRCLNDFLLAECELKGLESVRDELFDQVVDYLDTNYPGRQGDWMVTASGRPFWPFDPRPEDIHIEDIAHNLSMLCRFCGSVRVLYSVGQHSVLISRVVHSKAALAGLLHDASEAYIGDTIRPVKKHLERFKDVEAAVERAVCQRFGLDPTDQALWHEVKRGDNVLLATEFRDVARAGIRVDTPEEPAMKMRIRRCWSPEQAKRMFLRRFHQLYQGNNGG